MIQHQSVFVKDFNNQLFRVVGDNAEILIETNATEQAQKFAKDAIQKVAAQPVIEVERGQGSRQTFRWQGEYADLIVQTVKGQ